ncbi:hypothetical protein [Flavobacterium sp. '19STA2R22 D10 B1']|uniref:YobI family P-loop NTPase n=1 Tax=Flavobacterium aerium TaxID=3037261 RepID=UPI00278BDD5D|nr:hypothetical protein [Flavobacterium sp. '19STA2R22 D10 B1']
MKEKLLNRLKKSITWLESIHYKYSQKNIDELGYSSLSPIDNGDENGHYSKAIIWALKNRKKEDIKNIALTGPYGSGKSSILKTFQKNYKENDLKFLNISLATFKEEKPEFDPNGKEIKVDKKDLLRLIEISILEQIFYHEEDSKIPDSRFKKIKSYSRKKIIIYSLGYLLFTLALYNYFNNYFIQSVFKNNAINSEICDFIHYSSILIIVIGIFFIIMKSVRIISSITVNKLIVQNAEIGMGDSTSKSILNHHVDEILYFFSIRPYNVVIIEDLDRFQETEIFTKLRELNLLLNHSEKTKRKEIVFLYAVRDDMFTDKERTKFFDFIIPVIPVINSSNSSEILLKKKSQFKYALSDNLIEDISFFIDDMRLLHNISNEFYLYKEKLNGNLNQDKLFGIITYKNIYPNDFMKLSYNEGSLYKIFNSKLVYIKKLITEIEKEIEDIKPQIIKYEDLFIKNIRDLRLFYVVRIVEKLPGFKSFIVNNQILTLDEITKDENFEYLKTSNYSYNQIVYNINYRNDNIRTQVGNVKISEIENLVDSTKSYVNRENEVNDIKEGKINSLKDKIQELEKKKLEIRNSKICDLLKSNKSSDIEIDENLNKNLILILLRNGYISEDYIDYISLFHEESITRSDYQFHISVKNATKLPFDYKLTKIKKLIPKINLIDFETEFILNFSLIDHLLKNPVLYKNQINAIFSKLKDESEISIEFINGYYDVSENLIQFIKILSDKWSNIWNFISNNEIISDSNKDKFFKSIIEYSDIKSIITISNKSNLKNKILSNPEFLSITEDHTKLKNIIKELNLKFNHIDFDNSSVEMLDYIYQNNYYQINTEMIKSIIKKYGEFNQVSFDNSNYAMIKNSKAIQLIDYIDNNINDYINESYTQISTNINEEEIHLINLLNNEKLLFENKVSVIEQVETKISKLSSIDDSNLYAILLEKNKLIATWENLLYNYNSQEIVLNEDEEETEKEISESSIDFINIIENAEELSKTKLPTEINIYGKFWKKLIQTNEVDNQSYDFITKSNPWWHSDLNFSELSKNKIKSLINNNCINPVASSYITLKENFNGFNIKLFEKNKTKYFEIIDEITFDSNDLELILKSQTFSNTEKLTILNLCSDVIIITDNNLMLLSSIILNDNSFIIQDNILNSILTNNSVSTINRLKLFIKNADKYDFTFIGSFLSSLGGNYSWINDKSSKAKLPKNQENNQLLNILAEKKYISSFTEINSDYRVNHKKK